MLNKAKQVFHTAYDTRPNTTNTSNVEVRRMSSVWSPNFGHSWLSKKSNEPISLIDTDPIAYWTVSIAY